MNDEVARVNRMERPSEAGQSSPAHSARLVRLPNLAGPACPARSVRLTRQAALARFVPLAALAHRACVARVAAPPRSAPLAGLAHRAHLARAASQACFVPSAALAHSACLARLARSARPAHSTCLARLTHPARLPRPIRPIYPIRPILRSKAPALATLFLCVAALALSAFPATAQEPALPPGLEEPAASPTEPALPSGLEEPKQSAPALPEGLGDAATPALPEGLEESAPSAPSAPPLPPGLEESAEPSASQDATAAPRLSDRFPSWLHGFWDTRAGIRTQDDPGQSRDAILGETRLQLKAEKAWKKTTLEFTGDTYFDAILEEADFDLRRLRLTWTPHDAIDIRVGRQVLTWGTGDMLFINDLFPKDWQSFFSGRDVEYLKAPSDAIKAGWFNDLMNVEFVYTPQFVPDRYITGERISYWDPLFGEVAGNKRQIDTNPPSTWFEDDEFALRLYRNIGSAQLAFYGYSGYWKSPAGQRFPPMQATFPKLRVYGASYRTPIGRGIGNIEIGYYDSYQDRGGEKFYINNSEFRLLLGYERELAKEFTGAIQYYLEHMMDYDAYRDTAFIGEPRDKDRHVVTLRLTKLLMNQNLNLSFFGYFSPSDEDVYLRPKATYKVNDHWTLEGGANVFGGRHSYTFFGQFENNTNLYVGARYSF